MDTPTHAVLTLVFHFVVAGGPKADMRQKKTSVLDRLGGVVLSSCLHWSFGH